MRKELVIPTSFDNSETCVRNPYHKLFFEYNRCNPLLHSERCLTPAFAEPSSAFFFAFNHQTSGFLETPLNVAVGNVDIRPMLTENYYFRKTNSVLFRPAKSLAYGLHLKGPLQNLLVSYEIHRSTHRSSPRPIKDRVTR